MINFAQIKQSVTIRLAAETYGLSVNSHGMCRCPFHKNREYSVILSFPTVWHWNPNAAEIPFPAAQLPTPGKGKLQGPL